MKAYYNFQADNCVIPLLDGSKDQWCYEWQPHCQAAMQPCRYIFQRVVKCISPKASNFLTPYLSHAAYNRCNLNIIIGVSGGVESESEVSFLKRCCLAKLAFRPIRLPTAYDVMMHNHGYNHIAMVTT